MKLINVLRKEAILYKGASKVNAPKKEVGVGIVNAYGSLKAIKEAN